jgi:hypothetical protein
MCYRKDLIIAKKLVSLSISAKARGIEFDLSLQSLRNIHRARKCFYTGTVFINKSNHPLSRTIDRVDNSKGYVVGNVVACTKIFNNKKGSLTKNDIRILMRKVL